MLFFKRRVRFKTTLTVRYRDFLYVPYPHICKASTTIKIPTEEGPCVTADELTWTCLHCPESVVSIRVTVGVVHSLGFGKCIMTHTHHCGIMQRIFIALKILCAPLMHLFPHSNPWQPLTFLESCTVLLFPECHIVGPMQYISFC